MYRDEAEQFMQQLMELDDSELEKEYDNFISLFEVQSDSQETFDAKIMYCRSNGLTEDDLYEENRIASELIDKGFEEMSPIKQKLFRTLMGLSTIVNDKILFYGLHSKAKLRIEKLSPDIQLPKYAHEVGDSGMDVYLPYDIVLEPHSSTIVKTGFKVVVPLGQDLQVRPRSGMSTKPQYINLFIANSPGTIDASFRNEVGIILRNIGDTPIAIVKGDRIAQLVMTPVTKAEIIEIESVDAFPTTRSSGFGSSGS